MKLNDSGMFFETFISTVQNRSHTRLRKWGKMNTCSVVMGRFTQASCNLWQLIDLAKTPSCSKSASPPQNMVCFIVFAVQ